MLSLLRSDIENPSYKRGLRLTSAMLISYGLAFQFHSLEELAPDILLYCKYICLALAIFISFRAMAERRHLREIDDVYVSMIDESVISARWLIGAISAVILFALILYFLSFKVSQAPFTLIVSFTAPLGLFILGIGYAFAAKKWTDDPR